MPSSFFSIAALFCLGAAALAAAPQEESVISRDLQRAAPGGLARFAYSLEHADRPETGHGIVLKPGESYPIASDLKGPCAVYVSMLTPSPELRGEWGKEAIHVDANTRFYHGTSKEAFPPLSTIDAEGRLYGRNPAKAGESVAQELLAGVGDFRNGPLTIRAVNGEARLTRVRIRKLTAGEYKLALCQNAPTQHKTVIYNNDGYSYRFGEPDWNYKDLLQQLDLYANSDVRELDWCPLVSGAVSYPSKYADWFGDGVTHWATDFGRIAAENYRKLEADGMPIYPTLVRRGKEIGVPVWGSLRMSAYYGDHPFGATFNGSLWREHPEFIIKKKNGSDEGGKRLSFAYRPVREQRLGVLVELAEMGCQGVNLDFCRYPFVLGYDAPLIEGFQAKFGEDPRALEDLDGRWIAYRCEVINDFMRELHKRLAVVGEKRGEPVKVSVRLPAGGYRDLGFDPQTWAAEGLVNLLIVGWPSVDKPYDLKPWKKMVQGSGVELYGNIEYYIRVGEHFELTDEQVRQGIKPNPTTGYQTEDYLRRAAMLYDEGADGLYLFNNFSSSSVRKCLGLLGDKRWVKRWSEFEDPAKLHSEIVKVGEETQER